MRASLQHAVESGDYRVDPDAVAEAILRRARALAAVHAISSQVLVPAELFEDAATRADQLHAIAGDHGA